MRLFLLVSGIGMLVFTLAGVARRGLSIKHRRRAEAVGTSAATVGAMLLLGTSYIVAAALDSLWPLAAAFFLLFLVNARVRREIAQRDVPPPVRRIYEVPTNPLSLIKHPIRYCRMLWAAFGHPLRDRAEIEAWYRERGL